MNTKIHVSIAALAAAFAMSGCVSTGDFDKMQNAKNSEIATLKQQNASLQQDNSTLKQQKASLEQDNAALKQQAGARQQEVGALEAQQSALLASGQRRQQQYDALVKSLSAEVQKGEIQIKQYQNMLTVELAEQIFFDTGRAALKPGGKAVLKKLAVELKKMDNKLIRVEGHTDNVPIAKPLQHIFPTNWELSVTRATNVVRFLQDAGVPPENLIASGRSEYDPEASNDTPEGRQANRRIEIMLIDKSLASEMRVQPK